MFFAFEAQCVGEIVKVEEKEKEKEKEKEVQHGHGVKILGCND